MMKALMGLLLAVVSVYGMAANPEARREKVMDMVISEAIKADFPPALALAIADRGSNFEPEAISPTGERGVMQLQPQLMRTQFDVPAYRLFDARTNIRTGLKYLKQLLITYDDYIDIALSGYYAGEQGSNAVETPQGLRVIPSTRDDVTQVLGQREFYLKHPKVQAALDGVSLPTDLTREYTQPVETLTIETSTIETLSGDYFSPPQIAEPLTFQPPPSQSRAQLRIPMDAKDRIEQLDDFANPKSRLNQLLASRRGGGGVEDEAPQPQIESDPIDHLPAERQALVSNLRALRQYNLTRAD